MEWLPPTHIHQKELLHIAYVSFRRLNPEKEKKMSKSNQFHDDHPSFPILKETRKYKFIKKKKKLKKTNKRGKIKEKKHQENIT